MIFSLKKNSGNHLSGEWIASETLKYHLNQQFKYLRNQQIVEFNS